MSTMASEMLAWPHRRPHHACGWSPEGRGLADRENDVSCVVLSRPRWLGSCFVKGEPEVKGHPESTAQGHFLQLPLELALNPAWGV